MRRMRSCVLTIAAVSALGFVDSGARARGGEHDPDQARDIAALERVGGFVTPGGLLLPQGLVAGIEGTRASDDDLIHLRSFKRLMVLTLDGTRITDAGLAQLHELKNLRELDLTDTQVTDAGLVHLRELKHLRRLTIAGTRTSPEGVRALRRSLPWCRIRSGGG